VLASIGHGEATTFATTDVPTTSAAMHQYTINWDALSQGQEGVTIEKDSDGDGDFEEKIFTSQPNTPSNPSPANHATGVSIDADLSWTGGDPDAEDIVTYDVYFGTSEAPPLKETIGPYAATQTSISYDPGTLNCINYYWKIVAKDDHGVAREGPVWDFTTQASDILAYYRGLGSDPNVVETTDLLKAINDWADGTIPPGFTEAISTIQLLELIGEWASG